MMTRRQYLLGKLAEECNEVAQRALKAQHFGLTQVQKGYTQTNLERLMDEVADFMGVLGMLQKSTGQKSKIDLSKVRVKKLKVERYLKFSRSLGQVE